MNWFPNSDLIFVIQAQQKMILEKRIHTNVESARIQEKKIRIITSFLHKLNNYKWEITSSCENFWMSSTHSSSLLCLQISN